MLFSRFSMEKQERNDDVQLIPRNEDQVPRRLKGSETEGSIYMTKSDFINHAC